MKTYANSLQDTLDAVQLAIEHKRFRESIIDKNVPKLLKEIGALAPIVERIIHEEKLKKVGNTDVTSQSKEKLELKIEIDKLNEKIMKDKP